MFPFRKVATPQKVPSRRWYTVSGRLCRGWKGQKSVSAPSCGWRRRGGISWAVQERRQSVLPTPASGMLVSVRLCAHSQLEPRSRLSHSAGRECQLSPLTPPQSTTILLKMYQEARAHLLMWFPNRSLLMQRSFYFRKSDRRADVIIACPLGVYYYYFFF